MAILPEVKKKQALTTGIGGIFSEEFAGRIAPFGDGASEHRARIAVHRRHICRPISQFDAEAAVIAAYHGAAIATRKVADFEETGLMIVNLWTGSPGR